MAEHTPTPTGGAFDDGDTSAVFSEQERQLESLLDEALAPGAIAGGVPDGLSARVFAATAAELGAPRGVLARIGFGRAALAAAAAAVLALAVGLGAWLAQGVTWPTGQTVPHVSLVPEQPATVHRPAVIDEPAPPARAVARAGEGAAPPNDLPRLEREIAALASHTGPSEPIDQQLDLLELYIEQAERADSRWDVMHVAIESAMSEWEFAVDLQNSESTF